MNKRGRVDRKSKVKETKKEGASVASVHKSRTSVIFGKERREMEQVGKERGMQASVRQVRGSREAGAGRSEG